MIAHATTKPCLKVVEARAESRRVIALEMSVHARHANPSARRRVFTQRCEGASPQMSPHWCAMAVGSGRLAASKCLKNLAPQVGLEPTTLRLTAECSTIELLRSNRQVSSLHQRLAGSVNFCQMFLWLRLLHAPQS